MNSETCACPKCTCQPGADAVERDGQHYCCAAGASGHPQGEPCRDADCPCGGTTRPQVAEDRQLDDALKETFPASDPISP
ncbi:metallothionein [Pseudomonas aeruginosa]|uniref:metallothionein n=1 Tax=Pseudomonas aeruginosa TaxID=287 RepID=UPI000A348F6C|nr:metallothionein [Pseudomonas aeruginosa]OTJ45594.1 metallothionein [Pseudomonas aeruginosa]